MFDFSEKDSCGVGFIASRNIPPTHGMTLKVLECLANLDHRGAKFADGTGDGAGVLTEIPFELIRAELHDLLAKGFNVNKIHSEYGMTELLSQAYSTGNGVFDCPPWMQILTRDTEDALAILPKGKSGGINVIDLANYNSCSFIATQDLGKIHSNNQVEIIGRFDNSDIRGCNLMVL